MGKITEQEINEALDVLEGFSKGVSNDLDVKKDDNKEIQDNGAVSDLIKGLGEDLNSKLKSIGSVSRFLIGENEKLSTRNEELALQNEAIQKSLTSQQEMLEKSLTSQQEMMEMMEELANSPLNKLSGTLKKSIAVDKFEKSVNSDGFKTLSFSKDKRQVLGILMKSLETEEGQRRLGQTVGLIENGFVNQGNFGYISKSVQNEIGGEKIQFTL